MCQAVADGGRRCTLHHPAVQAAMLTSRTIGDLDRTQALAVFRRTQDRVRTGREHTPDSWAQWCRQQLEAAALDDRISEDQFAQIHRLTQAARAAGPPNPVAAAALQEYGARMEKASNAVARQTNMVAALRGVTRAEAAAVIQSYRVQAMRLRASSADGWDRLASAGLPTPPAEWIDGFTRRDLMAVSAPTDVSTLYAFWRAQVDPDAFDESSATGACYAAVDIETAGPDGPDGFDPENGSMLEVGVVTYSPSGEVIERWETLVRPTDRVLEACGTGAIDVHGISVDMVADAPSWAEIAPEVARRLDSAVMIAQNASFEQKWLSKHLRAAGERFDRDAPHVDTMCVARQHQASLPNSQLATICGALGVPYTAGHRALHDAEASGRVFLAQRRLLAQTWDTAVDLVRTRTGGVDLRQPPRANLPAPRAIRRRGREEHMAASAPWLTSAAG